jgi:hypothetical protein
VLFYVLFCVDCVVLCTVCVSMCTVLLPPGVYPIAVKYIISYHIISYQTQIYFQKNISLYNCNVSIHAGSSSGIHTRHLRHRSSSSSLRYALVCYRMMSWVSNIFKKRVSETSLQCSAHSFKNYRVLKFCMNARWLFIVNQNM